MIIGIISLALVARFSIIFVPKIAFPFLQALSNAVTSPFFLPFFSSHNFQLFQKFLPSDQDIYENRVDICSSGSFHLNVSFCSGLYLSL